MKIDTEGTYTLRYTAEDECGNTTTEDRTVVVEIPATYRTVLYTDGTFIINESSRDQATNETLHGIATNIYDPFDPNGDTNNKKYIFSSAYDRPWAYDPIYAVEIGSPISPYSTAYWFKNANCQNGVDLTLLDTSRVTSMRSMFENCDGLQSLDLSSLDTSAVENMSWMFFGCDSLVNLNVDIDTSAVTNMEGMFASCNMQSLDLSNFNTSNVTNMAEMFDGGEFINLDLRSFDTSKVVNMREMFSGCLTLETVDLSSFKSNSLMFASSMFSSCPSLKTIYASQDFDFASVSSNNSRGMFSVSSAATANLVGGAGTTWSSSNPTDKTYAHIDGGTSNPGYFTAKSA